MRCGKFEYSNFPSPCRTGDGRFKATITLYFANNGRRQISVAGKTIENYERKVSQKLYETYMHNRAYLKTDDVNKKERALKSADEIVRFLKTIKTPAVKEETEKFIATFEIKKEK